MCKMQSINERLQYVVELEPCPMNTIQTELDEKLSDRHRCDFFKT